MSEQSKGATIAHGSGVPPELVNAFASVLADCGIKASVEQLPDVPAPAHERCTCSCHTSPSMMHVVACCRAPFDDRGVGMVETRG